MVLEGFRLQNQWVNYPRLVEPPILKSLPQKTIHQ